MALMARFALSSILLLALAVLAFTTLAGANAKNLPNGQCDADNPCPSSAPCCSEYGFCGSGAASCLGGCDPHASFAPGSCKPQPRCKNQRIDFSSPSAYLSLDSYNGDPSRAPMTFDSGNVRRTKSGLKLELSQEGKAKGGTRLSSTRYMYYGRFTIVMRHKSANGVVSAAITMSNTKDEIDWEFTTSRKTYAETNFYWKGVDNYDNGGETDTNLLPGGNGFDVNEWHAYTVDWKPESITWEIDGKVIRTLQRSSTRDSSGVYRYPSTPSRLQISIWGAGSSSYATGTREWSGGNIDWSQADSKGTFWNEIKSLDITCEEPTKMANAKGTAYAYSSKMDKKSGEAKVILTDKSTTL